MCKGSLQDNFIGRGEAERLEHGDFQSGCGGEKTCLPWILLRGVSDSDPALLGRGAAPPAQPPPRPITNPRP